jgi:molybdopterin synthase sulfur carrier subunit
VAIIFQIPGALRVYTDGQSRVEIDAAHGTLRDVLQVLWSRYPGLRDRLANEQGEVREHINIFLGDEDVRFLDDLATPIPDGSEITIVPAISGGSPV